MLKDLVWSFMCCMFSCGQLCDPIDRSPLGSSVHKILQAIYRGLSFPTPEDLPNPGIEPESPVAPASAGRFFTTEPNGRLLEYYMYN